MDEKQKILATLRAFIAQRPGLEPANYISGWHDTEGRRLYRAESRQITRDRHHAEQLLRYVELCAIPAQYLQEALRGRRLTWDGARLDYCAGQYFPTEYRRAAGAALASALWYYWRDTSAGPDADAIRRRAHNALGPTLAKRFFA